ncbi:hypothetical protein CDAR_122521 [Caerostris darwini]|uniref:Uncharacterized protein n=1 Tax=Caerostris darwini TaxID=1538125 RepID=A0AAV4M9L0_9ARAC|nr:hypothetical protein CDAR_122521 [Caerostris darwini]
MLLHSSEFHRTKCKHDFCVLAYKLRPEILAREKSISLSKQSKHPLQTNDLDDGQIDDSMRKKEVKKAPICWRSWRNICPLCFSHTEGRRCCFIRRTNILLFLHPGVVYSLFDSSPHP